MTVRPYDNREYRYRHTDIDQIAGLEKLAQLLGVADLPDARAAQYDLRYFSGGIGVDDCLAALLPATPELWRAVARARCADTPESIVASGLGDDLQWLLKADATSQPLRVAAVHFINSSRLPFQTECAVTHTILFGSGSTVNDWFALWGTDSFLNCLEFGQG